jgi:hypothetical protein
MAFLASELCCVRSPDGRAYRNRKTNEESLMRYITLTLCFISLLSLSSCSSTQSTNGNSEAYRGSNTPPDGLSYFMPMRDIIVTLTVAEQPKPTPPKQTPPKPNSGKPSTKTAVDASGETKPKLMRTITVKSTPSYPDLSTRYVLWKGNNPLGKNTLNVAITDSGLLTSSVSKAESGVSEAFKSLATIAAQFSVKGLTEENIDKDNCPDIGVYPVIQTIGKETSETICGLDISIAPLGGKVNFEASTLATAAGNHSGIFYRQNLPYRVKVVDGASTTETIIFSPNLSPVQFLPVSKSFFSGNDADFGFVEGVPTKYNQVTQGEIVALLKLPADIIGAYFGAVGSIFDSFKTTDSKETAALTQSLQLELEKAKYDACLAAIDDDDEVALANLGCSS